jgi:peroxiredoxin Q/BCP
MIREYDVTYFMASVDTLEDNTAFAKKENADFPMLADPAKSVAQRYGVLSERGFANRWTFYIDRDGRIAHIDKAVKPSTSAQDMAERLGALGFARR